MVRTQIQLTEDQAREIKRVAAARNVSVATLIRQGVDLVLQSPPLVEPQERIARAKAAADKHHSDRSDVSRNHDSYLEKASLE